MQSGAVESCCVCSIARCRVCSSAGVLQRGASINTSQARPGGHHHVASSRPLHTPHPRPRPGRGAAGELLRDPQLPDTPCQGQHCTVKCAFIIVKICAACSITIWSIRLIIILLSCHTRFHGHHVILSSYIYICHYII